LSEDFIGCGNEVSVGCASGIPGSRRNRGFLSLCIGAGEETPEVRLDELESGRINEEHAIARFEFPVLVLLATTGMVRAFDDGKHVYIEFPAAIAQGDAPPLFLKGDGGTSELVNYRVHDNYYIVDQLFAVAELRLGTDPQQTVRIRKKPGLRMSDARP